MKKALVAMLIIGLTACGGGKGADKSGAVQTPAGSSTHDLQVAVALGPIGQQYLQNGSGCFSGNDHQVVVTNQSGTVLGSADLTTTSPATYDSTAVTCTIGLDIGQVPSETQYGVSLDGGHPIYFSAAETIADGYRLAITYGT